MYTRIEGFGLPVPLPNEFSILSKFLHHLQSRLLIDYPFAILLRGMVLYQSFVTVWVDCPDGINTESDP